MAITVNTNVQSLQVQRNLNSATNGMQTAMQRLTTGLRINSAADDAAGLVISKSLDVQQRGSEVASTNAQNGISLLQVAEGNLDIMQTNLMRIRDLTLQAMNGGMGSEQLAGLTSEATLRADEIDRIAGVTKFGEFSVFDSTKEKGANGLILQIGAGAAAVTNTIEVKDVFIKSTFSAMTGVDKSTISSAFMANDGTSATRADLETLLNALDEGIKEISVRRGTIGASASRLQNTVDGLAIQNENLSAASARIKDADIGKESANYTKYSILQQASAALLTQANQAPSIALSLIR